MLNTRSLSVSSSVGMLFRDLYERTLKDQKATMEVLWRLGPHLKTYWSWAYHAHRERIFDRFLSPIDETEQLALETLLNLVGSGDVLDIGAGSGRISAWLTKLGVPVVACEPDPGCAWMCDQFALQDVRTTPVQMLQQRFSAAVIFGGCLPVDNKLLGNTLHSVDQEVRDFMAAVVACIHPGGWLLLDLVEYKIDSMPAEETNIVFEYCFKTETAISPCVQYVHPRESSIDALMQEFGFQRLEVWRNEIPGRGLPHQRITTIWQQKATKPRILS
jgi:SAM-dependent methyltransferase